jgi:hypothetical protein
VTAAYLNVTATQEAIGAIEAQKAIASLQRDDISPAGVYLALVELAASSGWKSASVRSFVLELAKRTKAGAQ